MIPIVTYIFFGLFVIVSLAEIILAFNEREKFRKMVKPLCLLFLGISVITILPDHPFIYIGAFLGMVGDIFLIWKKRPLFMIGTFSFLLGHFFYISEILFVMMNGTPMPWWFYVVVSFSILLFVIAGYPFSKKITKNRWMALLGNLYLSVLLLVTVTSIIASTNGFANYMILGVVGGVSFLASDLILTTATFIRNFKRRDYYIMLFYLIGQAFIIIGITLTYVL
ncbi:MAG: lysoplasmalogenase [Bacilli bacterium]|jgi:uncharacterized membrane protein YhhN|nr:lysoplasmalogenase [Bacilli bacterium]